MKLMKSQRGEFKKWQVANFSEVCAEINQHKLWELAPLFPEIDFSPLKEDQRIVCPWDREKRPAFEFSKELGMFLCHNCNSSGTILDFHCRKKQIGYFWSVVELAEFFRVPIFQENRPTNAGVISERKSRRKFFSAGNKRRRGCNLC